MKILFLLFLPILCGSISTFAADPTAQQVVERMEKIRLPTRPYRVRTNMTEYYDGAVRKESSFAVTVRRVAPDFTSRNLIVYVDPPRDAGKILLINGDVLWFYDPTSKASVRFSPQQRIMGNVSVADVATINFAMDYTSKLKGSEEIDDSLHHKRKTWHLELHAKTGVPSYTKVELWIEQNTYKLVKGRFFSDSGRPLKISYYGSYASALGVSRPVEIIVIDATNPKSVTTMSYSDYKFRDAPVGWFQKEYLPHVKADE